MSSIYRKGRDGYFYYQTYLYNPNTGKKDKRVFHSLGTKDKDVALKKQKDLDKKYVNTSPKLNNAEVSKAKKLFFLIMIILSATVIVFIIPKSKIAKSDVVPNNVLTKNNFIQNSIPALVDTTDPVGVADKVSDSFTEADKKMISEVNDENKNSIPFIIPKYQVQRIDSLSGAFKQIKIFITIDKEINRTSMNKLCEEIMIEYSQFTNIMICLYADTEIGRELSLGISKGIGIKEQQESWIGMFTYNPVEGQYLNDAPARYLGEY